MSSGVMMRREVGNERTSDKTQQFGLEVTSTVTWQGWKPSREYTKNITLKNICMKTQKLKYRVPKSRFFSTIYPQPVMLSAGTSFSLPVIFRPLENVEYKDKVQFTTNEGEFEVAIEGRLPKHKIEIEEKLDFSICAVLHCEQRHLALKNKSELPTPFQVECPEPFSVSPCEGILDPYATVKLAVTFKPKLALMYSATAVLKYGGELEFPVEIKLSGTSKYAFLTVNTSTSRQAGCESTTVVNFGKTTIGATVDKWVELQNMTAMETPFAIEHPKSTNFIDTVFWCPQRTGIVPPNGSVKIPLRYTPDIVNTSSVDFFYVKPIGNVNSIVVKCTGSSKGPQVSISPGSVNFAQVYSGSLNTKVLKIANTSDVPADFQFAIDSRTSVFKFEPERGTIPPGDTTSVHVHFRPTLAIIYYRKVTCLLHNQEPLYVELMGTCHTETQTPAVLRKRHIQQYHSRVARQLSFNPPEKLNEMLTSGELVLSPDGSLIAPTDANAEKENKESEQREQTSAMDEYVNDGYHTEVVSTLPHVSFDVHHLDFGALTDLNSVQQRSVTVTNHTNGKIIAAWITESALEFSVSPASLEIPPLQASSFQVVFNPRVPNQLFSAELECFVYYKSARDYRLVDDWTLSPPWCLTLLTSGHTFTATSEPFIPRLTCGPSRLVFPAVGMLQTAYRTLLLSNYGATPISFNIQNDPAGVFSVKPTNGRIKPQTHQILVVKMLPKEVATYKHNLKLELNGHPKHTQEVEMLGSAEVAKVLLDNGGNLFFKKTVVGGVCCRGYTVTNVSRTPLCFEWQLHSYEAAALHVEPKTGVIQPNDNVCFSWLFKPNKVGKHMLKPRLVAWFDKTCSQSSCGRKKEFAIRAIGEGIVGEIKVNQVYVDFGTVLIGVTEMKCLELTNGTDCDLRYQLIVKDTTDEAQNDPVELTLDLHGGVLAARSRQNIYCSVQPRSRKFYQWTVSYQLLPADYDGKTALEEPHHLCHVLAAGVFPLLKVPDARSSGRAAVISKKRLWSLFSLNILNSILGADPSEHELKPSAAEYETVYDDRRATVEFNFNAAPVGSDQCIVDLLFENTGSIPCQMSFLFPPETRHQLDYWAEKGDLNADELHEMKVLDNRLFDVQPRRVQLQPGEQRLIRFTYSHQMVGTHRLGVLLKIARGREVLLNFVGVSVEPERCYLHFSSDSHTFTPVAIGEESPPVQTYELYNGGALPVRYTLDMSNAYHLNKETYGHNVFACMNPTGEVLPAHTVSIQWTFSPLEAKTYKVNIPIRLTDGQEAVITFIGLGYEKRLMGDTVPVDHKLLAADVPSASNIRPTGEPCYLSTARLSLGDIPLFTKQRHLVVIKNTSSEHSYLFSWHVTDEINSRYVNITPNQGVLQPGGFRVCKVRFTAIGQPAFYDIDLICELRNKLKELKYQKELAAWEAEEERQKVEFSITEQTLNNGQTQPARDRTSSGKLRSISTRGSSTAAILPKYQMLPPIQTSTVDEERRKEKEKAGYAEKYWPMPQPPQPFLIHLGLTARTHDIRDFQHTFPDQYNNFFIDQLLCSKKTAISAKHRPSQIPVGCLTAEYEIISEAITHVIRGLLSDNELHKSLERISHARIPYFQQLVAEKAASEKHATTPSTGRSRLGSITEDKMALPRSISSPLSRQGVTPMPPKPGPRPTRSAAAHLHSSCESSRSYEPDDKRTASIPSTITTPHSIDSAKALSTAQLPGSGGGGIAEAGMVQVPPRSTMTSGEDDANKAVNFQREQAIKKSPAFGNIVESLLENVLMNILQEAAHDEFRITARPRLVALPPRTFSRNKLAPSRTTME